MTSRKAADRRRADDILRLVRQRTQWMRMLDSIHSCMLDGMWLTSLRPVTADGAVSAIEISGKGFTDKLVNKADLSAIEEFRNRLRKSEHFTENTEIKQEPPVGSEAFAREFVISAALREPIRLR
jgi:hypothetical protein